MGLSHTSILTLKRWSEEGRAHSSTEGYVQTIGKENELLWTGIDVGTVFGNFQQEPPRCSCIAIV